MVGGIIVFFFTTLPEDTYSNILSFLLHRLLAVQCMVVPMVP